MILPALQKKIDHSIEIIKRAEPIALEYQDYGAVVTVSGGKDSTCLVQLVREAGIKYRMEHNLTTIDAPETIHFIKATYPECIINYPKESFYKLCLRQRFLPTPQYRFCCEVLKENTGAHTLTMTGIRSDESNKRKQRGEAEIITRRRHPDYVKGTFDQFTEHHETEYNCVRGKDKLVVNPILSWTEWDVWRFIHDRKLPYNPLYDKGFKRIGCLFCPMASRKHIYKEMKLYPKYYEAMLRLISRIKAKRIENDENRDWDNLTPEQIFDWWSSRQSIEVYKNNLFSPNLFSQ